MAGRFEPASKRAPEHEPALVLPKRKGHPTPEIWTCGSSKEILSRNWRTANLGVCSLSLRRGDRSRWSCCRRSCTHLSHRDNRNLCVESWGDHTKTMKRVIAAIVTVLALMSYAKGQTGTFVVFGNTLSARGKWKATTGKPGDEPAFKHVVSIECWKDRGQCLECTANVVGGEPDLELEYYEILRWDANGILAQNDSPDCMTNQLVVNFREESVMAIDSPKTTAKGLRDICKSSALAHTQTYKLIPQF